MSPEPSRAPTHEPLVPGAGYVALAALILGCGATDASGTGTRADGNGSGATSGSVGGSSGSDQGFGGTSSGGNGGSSGNGGGSSGGGVGTGGSGAGGSTASGGATGTGTGACVCGEADCGSCPMTPVVDVGTYGVDATEVTKGAYADWLATSPDTARQLDVCRWNDSFVPQSDWPPGIDANFPVVSVDWCDAYAYCAWAGKRLCGRIGGGHLRYEAFAVAEESQWYFACSADGSLVYPYGNTYDAQACNGEEYGLGLRDVGTLPGCEGGYAGLFDMSGNAWEWEDSCANWTGAADLCRRRGGSQFSDSETLQCNIGGFDRRDEALHYVGFRCCVDP